MRGRTITTFGQAFNPLALSGGSVAPPVPPGPPEDETLIWFGSRPKSLEPKPEPIKKKVIDDSELLVFFQ